MKAGPVAVIGVIGVFAIAASLLREDDGRVRAASPGPTVSPRPEALLRLPPPSLEGSLSLEEALAGRRSMRALAGPPLTDAQVGQLLWAAQGVTDAEGRRTAPSAGGTYPLEIYAVTGANVSRYVPASHLLVRTLEGDRRPALQAVALGQSAVGEAPLVIVVCGVYERTAVRYGAERAERYVHLEAGHAAQNVLLQAVAMRLGAVPIGAFDDGSVQTVLDLAGDHQPLYLIAIGHPA